MPEKEVTRQSSTIQVIDRASSLIDIISQYGHPVALKTLYTETGLNPATTHRILSSLWKNGLVQRTGAGLYDLGPKLNTLSQEMVTRRTLLTKATPVMQDLWSNVQSKVQLVERDGRSIVSIAECDGNAIIFRTRNPEPLHTSAVGKLFLGYFGESVTRSYLQRAPDGAELFPTLWPDVQSSRERGYAIGESDAKGPQMMGALVTDAADVPVAGLSISTPANSSADTQSRLLPLLESSCRSLSAHLAAIHR